MPLPYKPRVLLVEDTPELSLCVGTALRQAGVEPIFAADGWAAQAILHPGHGLDAVVLDLQIPGPDGLQLLQTLREAGDDVPVLILTARARVPDRVLGLNLGADDYLPKPFELSEFDARLAALLRRRQGRSSEQWRWGPLIAEAQTPEVVCHGQVMPLTPRENAALRALMRSAPRALSKEKLYADVFGEAAGEIEAVEVLIHRLRKKLDSLTQAQVAITTFRGLGYLLTLSKPQ